MEQRLNHFDESGNAVMVDVTAKAETERMAKASGKILMQEATLRAIEEGSVGKGDVLGVARVAGIMAAKKAWEWIPMCHPLMLTKCTVDFKLDQDAKAVEATAVTKAAGKTGVEMEALTAVSAALLTIYDMCKAMDRGMEIASVGLLEKKGGKSGHYKRHQPGGPDGNEM